MEEVHPRTDGETIQCKDCSKIFTALKYLVRHRDIVHNFRQRKGIKCEHCTVTFHHNWALQQHLRDVNSLHQCDKCDKTFPRRDGLKHHQKFTDCLKRIKAGYKPYNSQKPFNTACDSRTCAICDLSFGSDLKRYQTHMETVHPMKEEQTFQCQDCGKLCSSYKALVQHRDIRHNFLGRKQIQCDHCTKMFHNNWALKKHLRDVNTPGYKCDKWAAIGKAAGLAN